LKGFEMNIEIKTVKLSEVKLNPDNPRRIGKVEMERLVKSVTEFPEMLEAREVVCDENMIVLGGNQRLLALRKAGVKECKAKIVKGWTPEQKRRFIVSDNGSWGEWDYDVLSGWQTFPDVDLAAWGVPLPEDWMTPIPDENKPIDEDGMKDTADECPKCGFKW